MAVSFIHVKHSRLGRHRRFPVVLSYSKNAPSHVLFVQESQMQAGELTDWKIHFLHQGIRALSKGPSHPSTPPLAGSSSNCWYEQEQGDGVCHVSCNSSSPFDYLLISKPHWGWAGLGRSLQGFPCSQMCNGWWAALQLSRTDGLLCLSRAARGCSGCHCCESEAFGQLGSLPIYISKCFLA